MFNGYFEDITEFKEYATNNDISNIRVIISKLIIYDIINNIDIFKKIQYFNCSNSLFIPFIPKLINLIELYCSNNIHIT